MVGKTLSHYKILSELGRGGMGIVYKGEDTKLHRTVAIKVLPAAALSGDDDRTRFYREARAAAALTHPNIAVIHEIDEAVPSDAPHGTAASPFIAMEFIEGETLEARIKKGPLKLEEAVRIASEIASALEAAHENDIVHRDIKAANVMLTFKGTAKVLDFGLAQTAQSTKLTRMGSTLGTVAYMSPEQARGEEVDGRTDIWALGVTLYEMVAGTHPFGGDYEQAVVYSILNTDPEPLTAVRTGVPMGLEWIVSKMMAKQAKQAKQAKHRYQSTADLLVDLETVDLTSALMSRTSSISTGPVPVRNLAATRDSSVLMQILKPAPMILAGLMLIAGYFLANSLSAPDDQGVLVRKLPITIPSIKRIEDLSLSPDGTRMVFEGVDSLYRAGIFEYELKPGGQLIYYLDSVTGYQPEYSPNGRWITYSEFGVLDALRGISIHSVPGGTKRIIPGTEKGYRPQWLDDETIVFTDSLGRMATVPVNGGVVALVAIPDSTLGEGRLVVKAVSDDQSLIGFSVEYLSQSGRNPGVGILNTSTGTRKIVAPSASYPKFVGSDHLMYTKLFGFSYTDPGNNVVRRLSTGDMELIGPEVDIIADSPGFALGLGASGTLLFSPNATRISEPVLSRHDLSIKQHGTKIQETGIVSHPVWSGDFKRLAKLEATAQSPSDRSIEITNIENALHHDVIVADSLFWSPSWSPDGEYLYYSRYENGESSIRKKRSNGSGLESIVLSDGAAAPAVSPNGRFLAYTKVDTWGGAGKGIYLFDLQKGIGSTFDSLTVPYGGISFSSDSRYMAWGYNDGIRREVEIRSMDGFGAWTIRDAIYPKWDDKNEYLYYQNGRANILNRQPISIDPVFQTRGVVEEVHRNPFGGVYGIDFDKQVAYQSNFVWVDHSAPDAIVYMTENFEEFVRLKFAALE